MAKFLVIGDPHFKVDNAEESDFFCLQVLKFLQSNSVDLIFVLGDILHSHEKIYTFAMNTAVKFIKDCSKFAPVYCLVGNHDATSNTIYCSSNHWMNVLHDPPRVFVIERPTWCKQFPNVLCCPYVSDGRFQESLNEFAKDWQKADIIFAHQLFDGVKIGGIIADNVESWNPTYPLIISGHIHDRQQPQINLYYVGSSQQTAFTESGDKSLCLVSYDSGKPVTWTDVNLSLKQRKTLYVNVSEVQSLKFVPNVQYRIVIRDEDATIKAFKKTPKFKQLDKNPQVKSILFKPVSSSSTEDQSSNSDQTQSQDFLKVLWDKVNQAEDPELIDYAKLVLGVISVPMSDK